MSPQSQKAAEQAFFAAVSKLAEKVLAEHNGMVVVLVSGGTISMQGAGEVNPRELANALRRYADQLDEQGERSRRLILPGAPGIILRGRG